jgi:hypothetical protein
MSNFRELRDADVTGEHVQDIVEHNEPYIVGLDESGNYVSKHRDTGVLLNSNFSVNSGDGFSFFEVYNGNFVNGKREGDGKYNALDIYYSQNTLEFKGLFENNLPVQGKLTYTENGQFETTIKGFFVNGLPDETKECIIIYTIYENGEKKDENTMRGLISFRNDKGVLPDYITPLTSNEPDKLLNLYLNNTFKVTGSRQHKSYPAPTVDSIEKGVFNMDGEKLLSLGGNRSKKRSNYKRRNSHKN